jgi:hypothetical protein
MSWLAMVAPPAALLGAGATDDGAADDGAADDDGAGAADVAAALVAGAALVGALDADFLELQPASAMASARPVVAMSRTLRFIEMSPC